MCVCVCIYWASRNEKSEVFFVYAEQSKAQGIHKMPVSKPHCSCQKLLFQLQREKGSSNKKKKVRIQERKKSGKALLAEREKAVPTCPMTNNTRRENPDGLHKRSFLFPFSPAFHLVSHAISFQRPKAGVQQICVVSLCSFLARKRGVFFFFFYRILSRKNMPAARCWQKKKKKNKKDNIKHST